jgi:hypothetical protein
MNSLCNERAFRKIEKRDEDNASGLEDSGLVYDDHGDGVFGVY